jgi:hypothetical protein
LFILLAVCPAGNPGFVGNNTKKKQSANDLQFFALTIAANTGLVINACAV